MRVVCVRIVRRGRVRTPSPPHLRILILLLFIKGVPLFVLQCVPWSVSLTALKRPQAGHLHVPLLVPLLVPFAVRMPCRRQQPQAQLGGGR